MPLFPTTFATALFSLACSLWFLSEVISGGIIPLLRRSDGEIKKSDRGSLLLIYVLMYVSVFTAALFAIKNVTMLPDVLFYPGLFLIFAGILVRLWSVLVLGRFFTTTVCVHKDQKVVDHGPYRYVRHPSYLGLFMILIGIGLALHSWGGILVLLVINSLAFGYRIHVEERALVAELGEDYLHYKKRTKRLVPFVF